MMDKLHVYVCLNIASNGPTTGKKTRLFPSPFIFSNSRFLILTEVFRNDRVAACSTACRCVTEKNEMGRYLTLPYSSKTTQRSSTADWFTF